MWMYELFFTFSNTGRYEFFYGILSFTRGRHCSGLIRYGIYKWYIQSAEGDNVTALVEVVLPGRCCLSTHHVCTSTLIWIHDFVSVNSRALLWEWHCGLCCQDIETVSCPHNTSFDTLERWLNEAQPSDVFLTAKATRARSTLSTFNKVDRVEFNFVACVSRAL